MLSSSSLGKITLKAHLREPSGCTPCIKATPIGATALNRLKMPAKAVTLARKVERRIIYLNKAAASFLKGAYSYDELANYILMATELLAVFSLLMLFSNCPRSTSPCSISNAFFLLFRENNT